MAECIEREVANKWICETCDGCEGTFCTPCDGNPLKDIPAADVVERPRWIPVEERLPQGGENVLAYYHNPYNQFIVCATWDSKRQEWIPDLESIDGNYITAWMPLPEPPKEEAL